MPKTKDEIEEEVHSALDQLSDISEECIIHAHIFETEDTLYSRLTKTKTLLLNIMKNLRQLWVPDSIPFFATVFKKPKYVKRNEKIMIFLRKFNDIPNHVVDRLYLDKYKRKPSGYNLNRIEHGNKIFRFHEGDGFYHIPWLLTALPEEVANNTSKSIRRKMTSDEDVVKELLINIGRLKAFCAETTHSLAPSHSPSLSLSHSLSSSPSIRNKTNRMMTKRENRGRTFMSPRSNKGGSTRRRRYKKSKKTLLHH
jgi:hypothetical protein